MSYVLSVVDTAGIQNYIFGSNRLREHVGASELVLRATSEWIWDTLRDEKLQINWQPGNQPRDDSKTIEEHDLDAEVIYAGGGNALILFKEADKARNWARRLSKKALMEAPGLTLLIAHSAPFEWDAATDLGTIVEGLFGERLDELKRTRIPSTPLLGLGVTATCQSTGLVATTVDTIDNIRISREVDAKVSVLEEANKRFKKLLFDYEKQGLELPRQLDQLNPNKGERSYIAVIHADGNGIGKRFQRIWQGHSNRSGITALRHLSDSLAKLASESLQHALGYLITSNASEPLIAPYKSVFPVRPLIYGGDDLTLVCDGRIGVGLAARYLYEFEQRSQHLVGEQFTAAAGVAIVKTHYPFSRAYSLSEELGNNAKRLSRDLSTLDWHVAMSGTLASVRDIRQREYQGNALTMRPLYLHHVPARKATEQWRTWRNVEAIINAFLTDTTWAGKRNKIKQLREVLRDGAGAVKQFRTVYQTGELPGYELSPTLRREGWLDNLCGYFDPIELLDLYASRSAPTKEVPWLPFT